MERLKYNKNATKNWFWCQLRPPLNVGRIENVVRIIDQHLCNVRSDTSTERICRRLWRAEHANGEYAKSYRKIVV